MFAHGLNKSMLDTVIASVSVGSSESYPLTEASTNGWIMANINATGFFIVSYDEENWKKLTEQLRKDHQVTINSCLPSRKKFLEACPRKLTPLSGHSFTTVPCAMYV